jgi:murein DD-endopeptidase MepM/ murein hydrolase activator NlpD
VNQRGAAQEPRRRSSFFGTWLPRLSWGVAFVLIVVMVVLLLNRVQVVSSAPVVNSEGQPSVEIIPSNSSDKAGLPALVANHGVDSLSRQLDTHTIIPTRARTTIVEYTVQKGDSIFSISREFKIKPETVLWANYDLLDDNPNMLSIGQKLKIAPVDGVYYKWEKKDTIDSVASRFQAEPKAILSNPMNKLDMTNPLIEPDTYVMIPGGWRENRQWLVPTVWRANSGASRTLKGPGACDLPADGAYGSGAFIWPTSNHSVSGNDYWSGHLGVDIAAADGAPLYAADSGLVVYAGSIGGGYGLMIMIDHGNGYHTLYAHNSQLLVRCGQSVTQGQTIGYTGSTGNSTGPHLHFEVRYNGGFIDPHFVLP